MPDATRTLTALIRLTTDKQSLQEALDSLDRVQAGGNALGKTFSDLNNPIAQFTSEAIADFRDLDTNVSRFIQDTVEGFREIQDEGKGVGDTLEQDSGLIGNTKLAGSRRFLGAVGGLAGRVTPGGGAGFAVAGDLVEITKDLPKFGQVLSLADRGIISLGQTLSNLGGPIGTVASTAGSLAAPLGATAVGFASVLAVVVPVTIAAALFSHALDDMNQRFADAKKATDTALDAQTEYYQVLATGSVEDVQKAKDQEDLTKRASDTQIAALKGLKAEVDDFDQKYRGGQTGVLGAIIGAVNSLSPEAQKAAQNIRDLAKSLGFEIGGKFDPSQLDDKLKALQTASDQAAFYSDKYAQALASGTLTSSEAEKALEKLNKQRDEENQKLSDLEDKKTQMETDAADKRSQLQEDRDRRDYREAEDFGIARGREEDAHAAKMLSIQQAGDAKIEKDKEQTIEALKKADAQIQKVNDALAKLATDYIQKRDRAERDYQEKEADNLAAHLRELSAIDENAEKDRLKSKQDTADAEHDAELNNDVIAFNAAKKKGDEDLDNINQQAADRKKELEDNFQIEKALRDRDEAEKLDDMRVEAEQRRTELLQELKDKEDARAEIEAAGKQQLQDDLDAIDAQKQAEQDAYNDRIQQEDADRKLRLSRQLQDDKISDDRSAALLKKQLDDIQTKINAEVTSIATINAAIRGGTTALTSFINSSFGGVISALTSKVASLVAAGASAGGYSGTITGGSSGNGLGGSIYDLWGGNSGGGGSSNGGGSTGYISFGAGGLRDKPTRAVVGDVPPGWSEAMIPFRKSEGIGGALGKLGMGGQMINIEINGDIGNVSESFLRGELEKMGVTIVKAVVTSRRSP